MAARRVRRRDRVGALRGSSGHQAGNGPAMQSIGPLAFGPDGTLFAADNQGASVFALDLGAQANGGAAGAMGLDGLDGTLAGLLGTGARESRSPTSPCTHARRTPTSP